MYIYIYLYIYTHTRACARTHTHTKEAVHVGNNLASGRWSSWVILRRWRNKATSFCVFQSKAQRNTGTCMSSSSRPTEPKPLIAKLRGGDSVREDNNFVCYVPLVRPAGHSRGDIFKKRLHIVHSQLSRHFFVCLFSKSSLTKAGLKPNAAAVTFAVVCVPQGHTVSPNTTTPPLVKFPLLPYLFWVFLTHLCPLSRPSVNNGLFGTSWWGCSSAHSNKMVVHSQKWTISVKILLILLWLKWKAL